ncbi:SpoIVB peptidase S55 domain-containing protein [Romboutsia sp. 13368]|uniref:SpoIVB peptidase S55 domain-containing protein n=1 Tax=Romboutsia sp. 13368 TaxID=2708053 RepID=UPI0025F031A1|nr:SpoIVB peptidase S55 domain-containing protein [Romboutsia sp. 13368]
MKKKNLILFSILIGCFILCTYFYENLISNNSIDIININNNDKKYVYPLGQIVGIKADTDGVLVIGYEDEDIEYIGGIKKGDNIVAINDIKIENNQDISKIIDNINEEKVKINFQRNNEYMSEYISIKEDLNGKRLGLWVRDKISGIGTVTFYDPQHSSFKGIGHAITDSDTNELLKIKQGYIYSSTNLNIKKATDLNPGYIYGDFDFENPIGKFNHNSNFGIVGEFKEENLKKSQLIEVGNKKDIKLGKAIILLEDKDKNITSYDINIDDISTNKQSDRQISITVTDSRLINYTGGIIQGMSGAPIIQDNKLIGAITHVIKNNPKKGYGIFIDEMIELDSKR